MRHSAGGSYVSVFWQIYGSHTMQGSEPRLETRRLVFLLLFYLCYSCYSTRTQELEKPASAKNHRAQLTQYLTSHRISWELPAAIVLNGKCLHPLSERPLLHRSQSNHWSVPWSWCCSGSGSLEDADVTGQPLRGTWG